MTKTHTGAVPGDGRIDTRRSSLSDARFVVESRRLQSGHSNQASRRGSEEN